MFVKLTFVKVILFEALSIYSAPFPDDEIFSNLMSVNEEAPVIVPIYIPAPSALEVLVKFTLLILTVLA